MYISTLFNIIRTSQTCNRLYVCLCLYVSICVLVSPEGLCRRCHVRRVRRDDPIWIKPIQLVIFGADTTEKNKKLIIIEMRKNGNLGIFNFLSPKGALDQ